MDPATYGRSMSGIVESLTQAVVAEKTRAELAERTLAETQDKLSNCMLALGPAEAKSTALAAEKADFEAMHAAALEQIASKSEHISQLERRQAASDAALKALVAAVDHLVPHICELLLQAQEAAADVPQIEPQTRVQDDPNSIEAQRELLQTSLECAVEAFAKSSRRNDGFVEGLLGVAEPLMGLRAARRAVDAPSSSSALPSVDTEKDLAIEDAAAAWRRRADAQRKHSTALKESAGQLATSATTSNLNGASDANSAVTVSKPANVASTLVEGLGIGQDTTPGGECAMVNMKFEVEVPEGASPGDALFVMLPTGEKVKVIVPSGATPGSVLTCSAPMRASS